MMIGLHSILKSLPFLQVFLLVLTPQLVSSVGYELYSGDELQSTLPLLKDWCYHDKKSCSPQSWSSLQESRACNSPNHPFQSPINLPGNISQLVKHRRTSKTHYLNKDDYVFDSFTITNTGRTLQIRPFFDYESSQNQEDVNHQSQVIQKVTINKQMYFFHSLHFHWGSMDDIGSEHAIDGRSFPVEVHLVFYNGEYRDMKYPLLHWTKEQGLLVIAVFLDADLRDPTDPGNDEDDGDMNFPPPPNNNFLFPIVSSFPFLKMARSKTVTSPLIVTDIFRGDKQIAYKYQGSMTTPPCRENILWYVIRKPVIVPIWHIRAFRETQFFGSGKYANNFRSLRKFPTRRNCGLNKNGNRAANRRMNVSRDIEMVTLNFKSPQ